MNRFMEIKLDKTTITNLLSTIDHGQFKKSYYNKFIDQIDDNLKITSLQSAYYFYCYLYRESNSSKAKIKKGTIENLFNQIFVVSFDDFHNAVDSFHFDDSKGRISNNGGYYSLRRLENRCECEDKLLKHINKVSNVKII